MKSGKKRGDGKPVREIKSKTDGSTERRMVRERYDKKTKATWLVWRNGDLHHIHDKTHEPIEIWQKQGSIYWDNEGNEYELIKQEGNHITLKDKEGKEYLYAIG